MRKREKRERRKKERAIVDFIMVMNHFFHYLREWLLEMDDPRNKSYITYTQADLFYMGLLKNVCGQYSMRGMDENFNEENCIDTLRILSGNKKLNEMSHYDTLNYYLERLSPECVSSLRKKMVTSLIRGKNVDEGFEWIKKGEDTEYQTGLCEEKGRGFYANHVEEVAGKEEIMNVFEYEYEGKDKKQKTTFCWITNLEINKRNLEELIQAGRWRWKIENEGFNNQKNGLYRIEHLNSRNSNAIKNHYLITQIADILMQLYLAWNPYVKELKQTIKNTSSKLPESFRRLKATEEDVSYILRYTTIYLE